jgi:hypothetical protein
MQQALLVSTISLISVTLHFMRASLDNINDAGDFHTDAILSIEDVCMCLHAVLTRLGRPLHLQSLHFVWSSFSKALATLEDEICPGCPQSIPNEIDMPQVPRKMTVLMEPSWQQYRVLINPAYDGLRRFRAWFLTCYDVGLHHEILDAVHDSMLLLAAIADFCSAPIVQPIFLGSTKPVPHSNPSQG